MVETGREKKRTCWRDRKRKTEKRVDKNDSEKTCRIERRVKEKTREIGREKDKVKKNKEKKRM